MSDNAASLNIEVNATQLKEGTKSLRDFADSSAEASEKVEVLKAKVWRFNSSVESSAEVLRKATGATSSLSDTQKAFGKTTDDLSIGQKLFMERLREQAQAAGMSRSKILELQAAELGLATQSKDLIAQIEAATAAEHKHAFSMSSSLAKMEVMRVAHDAMIGSYSRMGSSLFVLGNATGLLSMVMSPAGALIAAAAGSVGLMAFAAIAGSREVTSTI